jgi:hypothetical protein
MKTTKLSVLTIFLTSLIVLAFLGGTQYGMTFQAERSSEFNEYYINQLDFYYRYSGLLADQARFWFEEYCKSTAQIPHEIPKVVPY